MLYGFRKEKYDRADMLMSAGLSTFVCSALLLITPRLGILLIEILLGLFLIGCAFVSRLRLNKAAGAATRDKCGGEKGVHRSRFFDRCDLFIVLAVILLQRGIAAPLRKAGWSEGTIRMLPLVLLAIAVLLKPRFLEFVGQRRKYRIAVTQSIARTTSPASIEEPIDEKVDRH
jgi:hypothetical protein